MQRTIHDLQRTHRLVIKPSHFRLLRRPGARQQTQRNETKRNETISSSRREMACCFCSTRRVEWEQRLGWFLREQGGPKEADALPRPTTVANVFGGIAASRIRAEQGAKLTGFAAGRRPRRRRRRPSAAAATGCRAQPGEDAGARVVVALRPPQENRQVQGRHGVTDLAATFRCFSKSARTKRARSSSWRMEGSIAGGEGDQGASPAPPTELRRRYLASGYVPRTWSRCWAAVPWRAAGLGLHHVLGHARQGKFSPNTEHQLGLNTHHCAGASSTDIAGAGGRRDASRRAFR